MRNVLARAASFGNHLGLRLRRRATLLRRRNAPQYRSPDAGELAEIEAALRELGIPLRDWRIAPEEVAEFRRRHPFPQDYHGGPASAVWDEKLLEHFAAWRLLGLDRAGMRYVDVAGSGSPWAQLLRARGLEAWCIDLNVYLPYRGIEYYLAADATRMPWPDGAVDSMSLQCAFEMFEGDSDTRFVREAWRALAPGGAVLVVPLYMHTHACYYSSPEYYDQDRGDADAAKYLHRGAWFVPASRKYSARTLLDRIISPARALGFKDVVHVLRNPEAGGQGIYLHFALELRKPA